MAWSDAARRAAVLARRLRRVEAYQPGGSRKQDQKDYLVAKLGIKSAQYRHRAKMEEFAARASFRKAQESVRSPYEPATLEKERKARFKKWGDRVSGGRYERNAAMARRRKLTQY